MSAVLEQPIHYADVSAALEAARTHDELLRTAQRIQHVDGIGPRERLAKVFRRRHEEFKKRNSP